jgi:hypothetical protein
MSTALRSKGATALTASLPSEVIAKSVWRPMGYLLGQSPNGSWYEVEPGNRQHFKQLPSAEEIAEEREWLDKRRQEAAKSAGGKA